MIAPGTDLSGYVVVDHIGTGGMGEVYRALDTKLGRDVAIKLLPVEYADEEDAVRRLTQEARVLASLNHPNIATLHGLEADGEFCFLVMELVPGETLEDRLQRSPMGAEEVRAVFLQIAGGLVAAHSRSVVHRDLKPANIKLPGNERVKILDFGLAKVLGADSVDLAPHATSSLTEGPGDADRADAPEASFPFQALHSGQLPSPSRPGEMMVGTPGYMSPEQAFGDPVDAATDLWGLGCCLYEALAGKRAFEVATFSDVATAIIVGQPDWSLIDGAPPALRDLVYQCLEKEPRRRPESAEVVSQQLRTAVLSEPGAEHAESVRPTPSLEQRLFDMSRDCLCIASLDGFLKRVNPAFVSTLGWSAAEFYGRPFIEFVHPDDRDATIVEMSKLAQGIPTLHFANRYECSDGNYKTLYWSAQVEPEQGLLYGVARLAPGEQGQHDAWLGLAG
ncbi:MAG: protein kinase [Gemmatimonadetes bacterium]|nr:protein kinase [Gemmatimonadota bacterium]